ncbi:MAG: hypothetical protein HQ594_04780, partial [Candidatus Omnitrophica bacterium]|nr:hypothetical protein [Candidatus Omnitrophota bacterium]
FTVGDGTAKTIRGRGSVGGLVGTTNQVSAADPIDGCIVETNVAVKGEAGSFIGGLVGYNSGANTKIKDCVFKGTVTNTGGGNYVGGLVGYSETATIENCDYSGSAGKTVAGGGAGYVGGLVGRMYSGTITVTGSPYVVACDVTSSGSYVGGFAGRIGSSATVTGTVRATGDVTGGGAVGGLVGYNQVSLDGYSAAGNVTSNGDSKGDIGGLVGYNASGKTLANCTASGTVTVNGSNGSSYGRIGGLVGTNYGTITDGCAYTGGTITALKSYYAGGFVGRNYGTINYTNPYTITVDINKTGTLVGAYYVGGLVGECLNSASSIRGAFTVGDGSAITIRGTGYTGGFVGAANSISATYPIDGCTVSANVSVKSDAGSYTGGFVGYNQSSNSTIQNCTTTATVEHLNGASYVGGFVGYNSSAKIIDCDYNGTATIDAGSAYYVGGFAGSSSGTITFSSRYTAQSDVTTTGDYVGGFAGRVSGTLTGTVTATGDVTGRNFVGGSIGENLVNLDSYYAEGRVIGADYVGGLLGYNNGKTVENCYASGNVGAGGTTDDYVGGLVGYSAGSSANINKCYATGTVTGDYYIGGLVGYSTATMPINDCYATGAPTGNYYVGGLVGYNASSGTVNRCYAAGDVTGNNTYGGLVGYDNNNTTSDYSANFWDISVQTGGVTVGVGNRTGASWDAVVTSKTTAQLRQEATFSPAAGWDFTNTWNIIEDVRYPFLRWRYPSTVAGIAYTDMEGTTPLTSVGLKLVKNGTLQTVDATTDATTGKYYFMLDTALAADDLILTYINDNATNGNTVTIVAADPEISGLDIYGSTVIARNEAAGTITNANFATGYYSDPGGDTLFGLDGSNNMDVNGSLIVWDAPSTDFQPGANLRVQDSFINNGTFTHGNKQVVFDGTSGGNEITSNSSAFYDVLVDGAGGGWVLQDAIVIGRNFQINNGTIDGNSKVITIGGNFTDNSSTLTNPGLVTFDGAGTWTVTSGNTNFGDVTFNNAGGTWTLQDDLTVGGTLSLDAGTLDPDDNDVYVGGGWDNNGGDFDHNDGGGVYFNGSGPQTIDPNGGDFNDLTFQGSGTYVFQDDLDVGGDCALSGGTLGQAVDIDITGSYAQSGGSLTCSDPVTYSFDVGDSFSRTGGTFNRYTGLGTTAADPYMVRDVFDLQAMDQDMYKHYKLAGNIDATPTQNWNDNGAGGFYGFAPVGSYFYRTLEGNNKTITGLYINRPGEDFVGLFQRTNGSQAIIQNVELVNPDITGRDYVGPLVGYHYNGPDIINCSVTGASGSVTGDDYVGGLVGENYGSGSRIENSDSTADVTGGATVGGLVGSNRTSAVVSECHATGTVTSTKDYSYVGGLIGSNAYSGTVEDSYATGAVSATGTGSYSYIGGLVGTVYRASVTDSYATGTATQSGTFTYSYAGGLVGQNRDGAVVEWCRAEGAVNAGTNGTAHAGGFVGLNEDDASVTDSYATGTASAGHYAGGFVGFHQETASISRCYATGVVTGTGPTGNGFGGFAGYTSSSVGITNCYATGGVTNNGSNNRVGGFAGYSQGSPLTNNYSTGRATYNGGANTGGGFLGWRTSNVFTDNYWDTDTSGINTGCGGITVPGVTGKTTAQMKQRATFASWDFDTVWMIDDGVSYPQFQWQHHVWTGDGATNNWSEGANWNLGTQPGAANWAFFKDDDKDATIDAGFAGTVKGLNISSEYSGTVTQSTNTMVSKTYSQYSGTFTCGTTLDVNGDLILGGGTLDPDGNDINVGGSWVNTGGTFNHNDSGEVIFDGTDQDVTSNGESFNDVDLDSSGTCTLQDDLEVAGTLTLSGGTLDPDGYDINVGGDWENQGGNFDHNDSGEVIFDGTDQEIRSNGESFNDVDIDTSDLTCTLQDDLEVNGTLTLSGGTLDPNGYDISVEGDWDNQGGSFDHNDSGEVVFDGSGDQDVTSNGESFNDVDFDSSGTCTLQDDLEVAGTLTLSGGTLDPDGNDVFLSGDWDNQGGSFDHNDSGEVIFDGDSQDVTSNGESFNDVDFDTSDQTATLQDDFEANNVTISGGTLDANGQGITVNGDWDNQGTFTHNRSTVTFSGNGGDITSGGSAFRHVVFNSSGNTWMLQDNFTARNVTISNGTLDGNGSNITVKGNWLNQDTFTHNNSTVRFRGAGGDITSGGSGFRHVFFNSSEQTWVLQDTFNAKNVTISQGTLDANGQNMKVTGDWLNQDIFTHNGNVVRFRGNSSSITSGGSSFNNVFFNKTGSTWTFQDAFDADGNFTITDGTVAAGAFQVNVGGDFADNSTTLTTSGLVIFDGSGNFTITSGSTMFNNLTFNNAGGTWTLQDALDVNGNLLIDNGTLACGANNINAAGNWTNNGTFNAGTGEVIFDGAGTSVLTGDTTFNDLTRNAAGGQLTVWEGSTQTVTGTLTLQGQVGNELKLRSSNDGAQWMIDPQGATRNVQDVDVQDSNNINGTAIDATNDCTDSGNNTNWDFGGGGGGGETPTEEQADEATKGTDQLSNQEEATGKWLASLAGLNEDYRAQLIIALIEFLEIADEMGLEHGFDIDFLRQQLGLPSPEEEPDE